MDLPSFQANLFSKSATEEGKPFFGRTLCAHHLACTLTVRYTASYIDLEILEEPTMESSDASHTSEKPHPKAFVCLYAQRDKPMYRELQKYLVLWKNQGRLYWADPASIQQADLILLFISPDFFATRGCQMGMVHALEVRTERGIPVIPVLARASNWKESACGALKALPDNDRPIVEWRQKERAYENICTGLARLLPDLPALGIALREGLSLFQARDLPQGYVARPTEFTAAKQLLLHRQGAQVAVITTALRGAGGFGKTTLALALCHDSEIQAAFPDGILWVELGEHPPRPIDVINNILVSLEPSHPKAMTLEEAKKRWRAALHDRVCLLVIDDIWQAEVLLPLLEGGPYCRRLVTTRNDLLLPNDAARVLVDAMDLREAVTLLCQDLPEEIFQATYQPQLEALAARLGYWPLLLTLARGMLTDLIAYGQSITEALTTVANAYQKRGVTAFRLDNAEERQQTVEACLRVSVQHLEKFTHPDYHATERYQELAVFPADTDIPLATLQIYWKGSAGNLELWETKDLCIRLHRLSLLLHCDLGTGTIRLHEVLRSYLVQRAGSHLPVLHGCLLDACQQEHGLIRWADLPAQEHYLWHHLVWHLCQANRQEALLATLTDLLYLSRKALYIGIPALEADFLLASTFQPTDIGEPARSLFEFLSQTIARLSHLLRQVHSVAEMSGFLLSHLGAHAFFARRKPVWEHELPRPFLTAWHPLPSESSSLLQRTLHGHAGRVTSCAISPDGRFIVSASYDGTLRVWETTTGAQRFSCKGGAHPSSTASLMGCAVSPDGNFVVSTCEDGSLKMWDAATGVEYLSLRAAIGLGSCTVSPDNRFIVSASADNLSHRHNLLKVWDTQTGVELLSLSGHRGSVLSCAVSPDGKWIVSASADRTLKIWDAITGVQRLTLKGHTDRVTGCAVSPDGKWIISASADDTLKVWDAITGVQHLTFKGHTGSVTGCAVSPDGRFIVSASDDKTLKMWNATTGAEYLTLTGHTGPVTGCAVSPDGRFIVSASDDRTLKVWKTAPTGIERLPLTNRTSWVTDCAVSPNGRFIVFVSGDKTLRLGSARPDCLPTPDRRR